MSVRSPDSLDLVIEIDHIHTLFDICYTVVNLCLAFSYSLILSG